MTMADGRSYTPHWLAQRSAQRYVVTPQPHGDGGGFLHPPVYLGLHSSTLRSLSACTRSLTCEDTSKATLSLADSNPLQVTELVLTGRDDIHDVPAHVVRPMKELALIDLTCCRVKSLAFVAEAPLANLTSVCIARNDVASLAPLTACRASLRVLRADDNRVKKLTPLAELALLEELAVRRNQVSDEMELGHLAGLSNLTKVSLAGNPFATRMGRRAYRNKILRACAASNLRALDGAVIEQTSAAGATNAVDQQPASAREMATATSTGAASFLPRPSSENSQRRSVYQRTREPRRSEPQRKRAALPTSTMKSALPDGQGAADGALARLLATFEADAVLSSLKPKPAPRQPVLDSNRRRTERRVAAGLPIASQQASPRGGTVVHDLRYPAHLGGTTAVVLRSDGGGEAKYPDGSLAVSAEPSPLGGWRVLACYPQGSASQLVAAVLDADGSVCANFPSGAMRLHLTPEGDGASWGEDGVTRHTFKGGVCTSSGGATSIALSRYLHVVLGASPERHTVWFAYAGVSQAFSRCPNVRSSPSDVIPTELHAEAHRSSSRSGISGVPTTSVAPSSATPSMSTRRRRPASRLHLETSHAEGLVPKLAMASTISPSPSKSPGSGFGAVTSVLSALDADLTQWALRMADTT